MRVCNECGRVNQADAVYCMTCATPLGTEKAPEQPKRAEPTAREGWREFRREEPFRGEEPGADSSQQQRTYTTEPPRQEPREGRFEQVAPVVEDFLFDVARAGARLYFGMRDPNAAAATQERRGGKQPSMADRFERFKDVVAEARVAYRKRSDRGTNGDRPRTL